MSKAEPKGFTVVRRNFGHWDICNDGRMFRVRGGPGKYLVIDERTRPGGVTNFKTIAACMSFICDDLMYELIVAKGQEPALIESWNVIQ